MSAIHAAAQGGDIEDIARLLDEDPELVHLEDDRGWLPLHTAVNSDEVEAVRLLLDRGAVIDAADNTGHTALILSAYNGYRDIVALLLERGADPSLRNHAWRTALMGAAAGRFVPAETHVEIIRLLLRDERTQVDARKRDGVTALWLACYFGRMELAYVLLKEGGADHTIRNNRGFTPKEIARKRGRQSCVTLLQRYEDMLQRTFLLTKARAVVDDVESIAKAPEKVGATTEAQAQQARVEAAPAYLRRRVEEGEALPMVQMVAVAEMTRPLIAGERGAWVFTETTTSEEERRETLEHVLVWLKPELLVELMQGISVTKGRGGRR